MIPLPRTRRAAEFPPVVLWLLGGVLALAPLPLGSNRPFFEALLGSAAGLGLLLWSAHVLRTGRGQLTRWRPLAGPALCCLPVLGWSAVQGVTLSVDPWASGIGLFRLATLLAFFLLAFQAGRSHTLARALLWTIALSSFVYAGYGLAVYASGNGYLLWFPKWQYEESLTGTFVNRNAFAASCGLGLLTTLALCAATLRHRGWNGQAWTLTGGAIALTLALFLSDSRAGLISVGLGLGLLWLGLFVKRLLPRRWLGGLAAAGLLVAVLAALTVGHGLIGRLSPETFARDERVQIWSLTLAMIREAPLTGHGLNTFADLFQMYRPETLQHSYLRAHSTYLELAMEWGIPAAVLWFTGLALIGVQLVRGVLIRRQNVIFPLLALAAFTQAATHAALDFSFQTPANAVTLAVLLGLGLAQSYRSGEQTGQLPATAFTGHLEPPQPGESIHLAPA